jgi:8-oxo-dGTP diphosphatase
MAGVSSFVTDPMEPEIEVAAGLIFRGGQLLVAQRRWEDHLGGFWEFPGGKRMDHETFEECLRRELSEELGVQVEVGELMGTVKHAYPEKRVLLKFFRCLIEEGDPRPLGCHALAWIRVTELPDYAFPAADAALIERLQSTPAWWDAEATPRGQSSP